MILIFFFFSFHFSIFVVVVGVWNNEIKISRVLEIPLVVPNEHNSQIYRRNKFKSMNFIFFLSFLCLNSATTKKIIDKYKLKTHATSEINELKKLLAILIFLKTERKRMLFSQRKIHYAQCMK